MPDERCRQQDSGAWYGRPTWTDPATGRRRYGHVSARTKRECLDRFEQARLAGKGGQARRDERQTVGAFLDEWLEAQRPRLRPGSWNGYEGIVRLHLKPALGHVLLARLTPAMVERAWVEMAAHGRNPPTVNAAHRLLSSALRAAERQGRIERNPCRLIDPPPAPRTEAASWGLSDLARFLAACEDDPLGACWALAVTTGLRRGELLALRWEDLDRQSLTLRVERQIDPQQAIAPPKTAASRRVVAITRDDLRRLDAHRARMEVALPGCPWMFPNARGRPRNPNAAGLAFTKLVERAGLPRLTLHGLRHTHATALFAAGVHPKGVQERLGHSSVQITLDRYSHAVAGLQHAALGALAETMRQDRAESVQCRNPDDEETA